MSILNADWKTIATVRIGKLYEWADEKPYTVKDFCRMGPLPNTFNYPPCLHYGDLFLVLGIERYTEALWDVKILTKDGTVGWLHLWHIAYSVREKL